MAKSKNYILVFFAFLLLNGARRQEVEGVAWVSGIMTGFKVVNEIVNLLDKLNVIPSNEPSKVDEILSIVNEINDKLDALSDQLTESTEQILDAVYSLKNFISLEIEMNEVRKEMNEVLVRYQRMELMSRNFEGYENSTKKNFAEWNVLPSTNSLSSTLFRVFFTYFGYQNILTQDRYARIPLVDKIALEFQYEETHNLCPTISAQQHFYRDYLEMTILEIKGHLVNKFSWTVLRNMGEGEFTAEEEDSVREHEKRTLFMTNKLREVIAAAGRELVTCDPSDWELGVNYDQLTRVVQGYIVNEVNINDVYTCTDDCKYHVDREVYGCYKKDSYCPRDRGTGRIIRCEFDTNKDHVTLCPSDNPARRYEYFETNRGKKHNNFYGERVSCPTNEILIKSWLRGFYQCSYCFCLMDEKSENSDRFFNLREVVSDMAENKVVTGVRFVKENRVMHLQIQQGELAPIGLIQEGTTEWKDVDSYSVDQQIDGVDYYTIDSYNHQTLNLDNIQTQNPESVVTGVKFVVNGNNLGLAVQVTKFDFEEGLLIDYEHTSKWITDNGSHEVKLPLKGREPNRGPNVSTRAPGRSIPSPASYDVVEFTHSDKRDDASQTTLPFLDTQNVVSQSATPLSGVGLYHKGFDGYGGFVAPKIFTLDLSEHI